MEEPTKIREHFEGPFGPPVALPQIAEAERRLGHELPDILKIHYAQYDGFKGPTNAPFFHSLRELVETTLWLRGEGYFPEFIQRSVAVGEDGVGAYWLIHLDRPDAIIDWDAEMEGEERIILDGNLTEAWLAGKRKYDEAQDS